MQIPWLPAISCPDGWHIEYRESRRKRQVDDFAEFTYPGAHQQDSWICIKDKQQPTYADASTMTNWLWCMDVKELFWSQILAYLKEKKKAPTKVISLLEQASQRGVDELVDKILNSTQVHAALQQFLPNHMAPSKLIPIVRCTNLGMNIDKPDEGKVPNPFDDPPNKENPPEDPEEPIGGGGGGGWNPKLVIPLPPVIPIPIPGPGDGGDDEINTKVVYRDNPTVIIRVDINIKYRNIVVTVPGDESTRNKTVEIESVTNERERHPIETMTCEHLWKEVAHWHPLVNHNTLTCTRYTIDDLGTDVVSQLILAGFKTAKDMHLLQYDVERTDGNRGSRALFKPVIDKDRVGRRSFDYYSFEQVSKNDFYTNFRRHEIDTLGHPITLLTHEFFNTYPNIYYRQVKYSIPVELYDIVNFYKTTHLQSNYEDWYAPIRLHQMAQDRFKDKYFDWPDEFYIKFY